MSHMSHDVPHVPSWDDEVQNWDKEVQFGTSWDIEKKCDVPQQTANFSGFQRFWDMWDIELFFFVQKGFCYA